MKKVKEIYLGIGSNLGNRSGNLTRAVELISSMIGPVKLMSGVYESTPWGFDCKEKFLNQVVCSETAQEPDKVLEMVHIIETLIGRERAKEGGGYHPRVIDIDILFYGNEIINRENLVIPHPFIHRRLFVLVPLCSIAPGLVHPVFGKSIRELFEECTDSGEVVPFTG